MMNISKEGEPVGGGRGRTGVVLTIGEEGGLFTIGVFGLGRLIRAPFYEAHDKSPRDRSGRSVGR